MDRSPDPGLASLWPGLVLLRRSTVPVRFLDRKVTFLPPLGRWRRYSAAQQRIRAKSWPLAPFEHFPPTFDTACGLVEASPPAARVPKAGGHGIMEGPSRGRTVCRSVFAQRSGRHARESRSSLRSLPPHPTFRRRIRTRTRRLLGCESRTPSAPRLFPVRAQIGARQSRWGRTQCGHVL